MCVDSRPLLVSGELSLRQNDYSVKSTEPPPSLKELWRGRGSGALATGDRDLHHLTPRELDVHGMLPIAELGAHDG